MCPRVQHQGVARWFACPFGGVECRGQAQHPTFASGSLEVAVGLLVSLYLVVYKLP